MGESANHIHFNISPHVLMGESANNTKYKSSQHVLMSESANHIQINISPLYSWVN